MPYEQNKWFGNRLREILEEKKLKKATLAALTGINRMTLKRIIEGRYATAEEVQKMADALGVSVERLRQKDVEHDLVSSSLYREIRDPQAEVQAALHAVSQALGATEKGLAYETLGAIYARIQDVPRAIQAYEKSYSSLKDAEDPELAFRAYRSYIGVLIISQQFDQIEACFAQFEAGMRRDETNYIRYLHHTAVVYGLHLKKYDRAIALFEQILAYYERQANVYMSTVMRLNIGDSYFFKGDYAQAKLYYDAWYNHDPENTVRTRYYYLCYCRDYAKILFTAGENERALSVLERLLPEVEATDSAPLISHCYLLLALIKRDITFAQRVLDMECAEQIKMMAALVVYFDAATPTDHTALRPILAHPFAWE